MENESTAAEQSYEAMLKLTSNLPDRYDFVQYLTDVEKRQWDIEEKTIRDTELELIRKFTKISGDRITKEAIIKLIFDRVTLLDVSKLPEWKDNTDRKYEYVDGKHEFITIQKTTQQILSETLNKLDNQALQSILNILQMIELPSKE